MMLIHLDHCDGTAMFSKYQYEGDKLPPTKHVLLHMMYRRSHYMARVWRSSHISKAILPDPCKFGWKLCEDIENCYESIMTDQKPVPVSVAELSFCWCKHGCDTKRCTCKKTKTNKKKILICSEMWFCHDCENQPIFSEGLSLNDNENEGNENGTYDIDYWDY